MNYLKKIILVLLFLFPISNSFGAMATYVQKATVDDSGTYIQGIEFNPDGTKMFIVLGEKASGTYTHVSEYNLSTPFDISTKSYAGNSERCILNSGDEIDGPVDAVFDLDFSKDGMKLFVGRGKNANGVDKDRVFRFDLTSPYDISTCSFASQTSSLDTNALQKDSNAGDPAAQSKSNNRLQGLEINDDGTKIFIVYHGQGAGYNPRLLEYNLSTPYDLTTISLATNAGINLDGQSVSNPMGMQFSSNGKRLWIVSHTNNSEAVTQISLNFAYDTSSFTVDGSLSIKNLGGTNNFNEPRGIGFSTSGLKMYVGTDKVNQDPAGDHVKEIDLVCPFNIISGKCPSISEGDRTGIAEAQIEIAKRTIENSTDNALNRLKWIRRNKDIQNLSHQNIKLNFSNEMLASLTEVINISTKPKKKNKDQEVFYWSEGSMGFGEVRKTDIASFKKIKTDGITVGVDKFTKNNGIKGLAFRFGKNDVSVGYVGSKLDTDTYNLTYYSTSPLKDNNRYLDTVIGIGALKSDILSVLDGESLTGNRNGKQIYGTVKLKNEIKKDDLTLIPSGQIDLGYTLLSSYSESGKTAMRFDEQRIRSRSARLSIASVEEINHEKYKMKRHGKLEYKANLHRSSNIKYSYISDSTNTKFDTELSTEALHNINGEIGLDIIFSDNFSIFFIYEHKKALGVGYTNKINIAIGYLPNKNTNYAFSINGSENLISQFIVKKNINGYDLTFNLNDDLTNLGNNREASINLNKVF
ncbi:MAG: autotransporter domain-containing protein [Candidatus Pelagibacter sp.]